MAGTSTEPVGESKGKVTEKSRQRPAPNNVRLEKYLTTDGFMWKSEPNPTFAFRLRGSECDQVVRAFKKEAKRPNVRSVAAMLAQLFEHAATQVDLCQSYSPAEFWEEITSKVHWAEDIEGDILYDLSIKIIAARQAYLISQSTEAVVTIRKALRYDSDTDRESMNDDKRYDGQMADAVDLFMKEVQKMYRNTRRFSKDRERREEINEERKATRDRFCPPWIFQSENEEGYD